MKLEKERIDQYNAFLKAENTKFDVIGGYEVVLSGVVHRLPEIYGENTAKNFAYQLGATPGQNIAKVILNERNGQIFRDPVEALVSFSSRLTAYHQMEIEEVEVDGSTYKIVVKNRCYFDSLFARRPDIPKGGILCRINKGYFEEALKGLTELKVNVEQTETSGESCKLTISFS